MENIEMYLIKNFPHIAMDNISTIIECAKEDVINYCNLVEVPTGLYNTLLQMCIHKCNTINDIGISGTGGSMGAVIGLNYDFDYPPQIIKNLRRFRKLA